MNHPTRERCIVCGTELTAFNRAIGTAKCADCSRGTSPAAQRQALFQAFAAEPGLTEQSIAAEGFGSSVGWLVAGGIVAEAISIGAILSFGHKSPAFSIMIGCAIGYFVGGVIVGLSKKLVHIARWASFRNWLMGIVSLGFIASIFADDTLIFASLPVGLVIGLVATAATDAGRKATLIDKLREYRASVQPMAAPMHPPPPWQPAAAHPTAQPQAYPTAQPQAYPAPQPQAYPAAQPQPYPAAQPLPYPAAQPPQWPPAGGHIGASTVVLPDPDRDR